MFATFEKLFRIIAVVVVAGAAIVIAVAGVAIDAIAAADIISSVMI